MKVKQFSFGFLVSMSLLISSNGFAGEQVTVDKEEYEQLKAAVKFLMSEREENKKAVQDAKHAAEEAAASAKVATDNAQEATEVAEAAAEAIENPLLEGLQNLSIGGYGEVHYNNLNAEDDSRDLDEFDIHRFVLFFGYQFTEKLRFFSEFEIEHGGVESDGDPLGGEVEIEQAYIEYDFNNNSSVLGGVFLIPVGILNETHEPDTFYGVERNNIEAIITPATWWAVGSKLTHVFDAGFKLEAAVHSGLEIPTTGGNAYRVRSGRQKASNADGSHVAYTGAVTYTGVQGLEVGLALQHQDDASQTGGDGLDDGFLYAAHLAYAGNVGGLGVGLRAYYAEWDFDGDAVEAADDDEQKGWYIEPSIKPIENLGFFFRYEDVEGARERDEFNQWTLGANWWLHEHVVLKADYQDREHDEDAEEDRDFKGYNLGIGWQF
ncbi:MAG: porin [Gammaproteobacteria bacterium]|nr:porin [Gammaproteobacteria bacterium]